MDILIGSDVVVSQPIKERSAGPLPAVQCLSRECSMAGPRDVSTISDVNHRNQKLGLTDTCTEQHDELERETGGRRGREQNLDMCSFMSRVD